MQGYNPIISLKKALSNGGWITLLAYVAWMLSQWYSASGGLPVTVEAWKSSWPIILSGVMAAIYAGVKNWWKNSPREGGPNYRQIE